MIETSNEYSSVTSMTLPEGVGASIGYEDGFTGLTAGVYCGADVT